MAEARERVRAGEEDPPCLVCGGILKSDTISFGQQLDEEVMGRAFDAAEQCDLLIAAGSTLAVYPAANVVPHARVHRAPDRHRQRRTDGHGPPRRRAVRGPLSETLRLFVR